MKAHFLLLFIGMMYNNVIAAHIFHKSDHHTAENNAFTIQNIVMQKGFAQMLMAKASSALKVVPETEQQLFMQCARSGKTSQSVAKCLVQLFEARDNSLRRKNNAAAYGYEDTSENSERGLIATGIQWMKQMFIEPLSKMKKALSNDLEALNKAKMEQDRKRHLKKLELTYNKDRHRMALRTRREIEKKKTHYANLTKHQTKKLTNLEKIERIRIFQDKYFHYTENIGKYNEMRKSVTDAYQLRKANITQNRTKKHISNGMKTAKSQSTKKPVKPKNNARYFSPKIFSFVPTSKKNNAANWQSANDSVTFMSPELLRLYEDEDDDKKFVDKITGTFGSLNISEQTLEELFTSVPNLLRLLTPDKTKRRKFLDNILEALNIGQILDQILEPITFITDTLDKGLLNTSKMLKESMEILVHLKDSMTREQHNYYLDNGYTFLSEKQMEILRTGKIPRGIKRHVWNKLGGTKFTVAAEHMEDEIERHIRERAASPGTDETAFKTDAIDEENVTKLRQKRDFGLPISGPVFGVLSPFAFVPQMNTLQLFTLYVLSPQAFIPSYKNPAAFYMQLLSPWAFLASLYSPQFFTCVCLSPTAFEANLFSPQFIVFELLAPTTVQANLLNPYMLDLLVLSPQALITDLLSPQLIQPQILSPQFFMAQLLSPPIGSPAYLSDTRFAFRVLSPDVFSPNIASKIKDSVFIFSPEIGGGHDESEFETEGDNVFFWPKAGEPDEEAYVGENSAHPDTDAHIHPNIVHPEEK